MPKNKTSRLPRLPAYINERSVLAVLAIVLLICVVVLMVKDNRRQSELIDPVVTEQNEGQ